jgi:hypothetical protein
VIGRIGVQTLLRELEARDVPARATKYERIGAVADHAHAHVQQPAPELGVDAIADGGHHVFAVPARGFHHALHGSCEHRVIEGHAGHAGGDRGNMRPDNLANWRNETMRCVCRASCSILVWELTSAAFVSRNAVSFLP